VRAADYLCPGLACKLHLLVMWGSKINRYPGPSSTEPSYEMQGTEAKHTSKSKLKSANKTTPLLKLNGSWVAVADNPETPPKNPEFERLGAQEADRTW
jgi:hypothetical protein